MLGRQHRLLKVQLTNAATLPLLVGLLRYGDER